MRSKATSQDPYSQLLCGPLSARPGVPRQYALRLWVSVRHRWLNYLLAGGASPAGSRALALRARQLTSRASRDSLATSIGSVLCGCTWRQRWRLVITPQPECVEASRDELEAIKEILTGGSLVYARGVAMTMEFVQSAASPLFDPGGAESAWSAAQLSLGALQGHV